MVFPFLLTRVIECYHDIRVGVDAAEVRAFVGVAATAAPGQVFQFVAAAVLPGNNVIDLEYSVNDAVGKMAVFATSTGSLADRVSQGLIHAYMPLRRKRLALSFNRAIMSP
jgi:hypothetical protein